MLRLHTALATGVILFAASSIAFAAPKADKAAIKAHLSFLADDMLEGRETGSRGYDIAAAYVASQFAQYGVLPKGEKGGYLQAVPMRSTRLVPGSAAIEMYSAAGVEPLSAAADFMTPGSATADKSTLDAPMVFVGYGIRSDRFKHDDYANVDVKGKIVVVLQGNPKAFPTEEGAHFGSSSEKRKLAAQQGAVGMVTLWTPVTEKMFAFDVAVKENVFPSMVWLDAAGKPSRDIPGMQDAIAVSMPTARKMFSRSGVKVDDIFALAAASKPIAPVDLKTSLRMSKSSTRYELKSNNVVGMIEGSDPKLKNEYVVLSAHLDHIGQVKEKTGDNIFNGAMDNASGIATMLETARLFSQSGVKPKRSILFIALTGEEKGLLGSDYFATNPTVPAGAIVANVNLDMPLLTFDFKNVIAFGAEHSSLKGNAARGLEKMGLSLMPDPWPSQGIFTRSDHYSFVRQGVPSVFLVPGFASFNKADNGEKAWGEFLAKHYHQPGDDLTLPFNFDAAARFAQLNYNIALEIANDKDRPTWNKGDFFGDTFKK